MPKRTTVITARIAPDKALLDDLVKAVGNAGAQKPVVVEVSDDGYGIVRATFDDPDAATQFERYAQEKGGMTWRRLTLEAVLSWVGQYARVTTPNVQRCGEISQLDENTIRITPRGNLGGLDLGPSSFGSEKAGDAAIADVVDIVPARPGEV